MEPVLTDEFLAWFEGLDEECHECYDAMTDAIELLAAQGFTLGHPYSSDIKDAKYALRELRKRAGKHVLRAIYCFDPSRSAVLLIGGDKAGDDRFYDWIIPLAEKIWEQYLKDFFPKKQP
jgi:hypothetical protein